VFLVCETIIKLIKVQLYVWYARVASRFGKLFLTTCSLLLVGGTSSKEQVVRNNFPKREATRAYHSRQLCMHLNIACLYLETEIIFRRNFYTGGARGGRALDAASARSDGSTCGSFSAPSKTFCFCGGGRACPTPAVMNRDAALTSDEIPLALSRALCRQGRMEGAGEGRGCERSNKGTQEGDIARSSGDETCRYGAGWVGGSRSGGGGMKHKQLDANGEVGIVRGRIEMWDGPGGKGKEGVCVGEGAAEGGGTDGARLECVICLNSPPRCSA
jgi:hypothetical protein